MSHIRLDEAQGELFYPYSFPCPWLRCYTGGLTVTDSDGVGLTGKLLLYLKDTFYIWGGQKQAYSCM